MNRTILTKTDHESKRTIFYNRLDAKAERNRNGKCCLPNRDSQSSSVAMKPSFNSAEFQLEKVMGLTGFVIIHVFIASFSPAQGERNQMVNAKFTRPVNAMPMSNRK